MKRTRPVLVALAAVVLELIAIAAACNQAVADNIQKHDPAVAGGGGFGDNAKLSLLSLSWRFSKATGESTRDWLADFVAIAVVIVVLFVVVLVLARGAARFGQVFFGVWFTVAVATPVAVMVRAMIVKEGPSKTSAKATFAVFGSQNSYALAFGIGSGLLVGALTAAFLVLTRRPEVDERAEAYPGAADAAAQTQQGYGQPEYAPAGYGAGEYGSGQGNYPPASYPPATPVGASQSGYGTPAGSPRQDEEHPTAVYGNASAPADRDHDTTALTPQGSSADHEQETTAFPPRDSGAERRDDSATTVFGAGGPATHAAEPSAPEQPEDAAGSSDAGATRVNPVMRWDDPPPAPSAPSEQPADSVPPAPAAPQSPPPPAGAPLAQPPTGARADWPPRPDWPSQGAGSGPGEQPGGSHTPQHGEPDGGGQSASGSGSGTDQDQPDTENGEPPVWPRGPYGPPPTTGR